jgi:hypothetical protein
MSKGYVYKRGNCWFHEVQDRSGKPVLMDNTGNWRIIFDACFLDVGAVRRIEQAGHKLKHSYPQLVDKAEGL